MSRKGHFIVLTICAVGVAAMAALTYQQTLECSKAGGVRMRELLGQWHCYQQHSLKELKP